MNELEYKGLILKQNIYNYHYMIFEGETNEALMYCSCNKKLTENDMKKAIDRLLLIRESITNDVIYRKGKIPKGLIADLESKGE